jgi:hypothetical protein
MDRLSYRTHTQLMLDSENRKMERTRSDMAVEALRALEKSRRARRAATLWDRASIALEWLLMGMAMVGGWYGFLVFFSEYVCTFRGVC